MLTARLFGGLRVWVDDREVPTIPGLRPRSVLAYLLLNPGPHPRVRLAGRFWPDVLDTSARGSLRNALWTVREALEEVGGGAYLAATRTHAGIDPALPRTIDAEEFSRLAGSGEPVDLERAVLLAQGPLLADLADEWVLGAQDTHRDLLVGVLERLAAASEAGGDPAAAAAWTRRAIEHDRLRESLHRDLMRRLDAAGERARALAAYRRLRDLLGAELGLRPSDETRALAEGLRGPSAPPPPTTLPPVPETTPLAGRADELRALRAAWDGVAGGAGGVVVVAGPAGTGASRILDEMAAWAAGSGARVVTGAALDLEGAPPLAPWSEALREMVATSPAPGQAWASDLARLSPAVESLWNAPPRAPAGAPELERTRLFEAVSEAVAWCAGDRPLLVALHGLQRADPATTALLGFVGRRLEGTRALVAIAHREDPPNPHLDAALGVVRARGLLRAEVLLGSRGSEEPAADGLREVVRGPLAALAPPARALVAVAAVAGRALEPGEVAELVRPEAPEGIVTGCVESGLLTLDPDRRLAFRHALQRTAAEAELDPFERTEAHRRLAEALGRRAGRRPAEVARHLLKGGEPEAAQRHLVEAAAEARGLGALDEAAAFLAEAAGLVTDDPARVAEITLLLADVHSWRGDRVSMDAAFRAAEAILVRVGEEAGLALAYAFRGRWLHTTLCYPSEALTASRRALELVERGGLDAPEARMLALSSAAWAESVAGDPAAVAPLVASARAVDGAAEDEGLASELEQAEGMALLRAGDLTGARAACERAADRARRAGRHEGAALSLLTAAAAAACAGDLAGVLDLADRSAAWPWAGVSLEVQMRAARAYALARLGRHREAVDEAERNLERAAGAAGAVDVALARYDLGVVELAAGTPARAAASIAAALDDPDGLLPRAQARLRLAEALAGAGDADAAERELERVPFEPVGGGDMPDALVPALARVQGLVAATRGDAALAERRFAEAEAAWERIAGAAGTGGAYAAVLVDLGRPPVAGLVEPERELARLAGDRRALNAAAG